MGEHGGGTRLWLGEDRTRNTCLEVCMHRRHSCALAVSSEAVLLVLAKGAYHWGSNGGFCEDWSDVWVLRPLVSHMTILTFV